MYSSPRLRRRLRRAGLQAHGLFLFKVARNDLRAHSSVGKSTAFTWQGSLVQVQLRAFEERKYSVKKENNIYMGLKEEIRELIRLQEIDTLIYKLQEKKNETLPARLEEIKREFEETSKNFTSAEEKLKSLQLEKKDKEIELATKEEGLKKLQTQLYQLKTNKEYQAMLTEIGSHKADISVAEEGVLTVMDRLEKAKKECAVRKEALSQEEKAFKSEEEKIASAIRDAEAEISNLGTKRKALVEGIDKEILATYERLLNSLQGLALVPVKGVNCGACHMRLNHQKINEIKMFGCLVSCDSCVRILYIPEDIQG